MNILVLNGSPKGDYSITLQTAKYIEKFNKEHSFEYVNVGQRIKAIEKDASSALQSVENSDLIIFTYPVYTFLAPYQLHRFIELLKEQGVSLAGKVATQITTSKHFYDVTAHRYVQDNCNDLGLKYISGLSADMEDLLTEKGQKDALGFFKYVCHCIDNGIFEPVIKTTSHYKSMPVKAGELNTEKTGDVVVLTNCEDDDLQLKSMIDHFCNVCSFNTRVINLTKFAFKGGCLGCMNCATDGNCVYKDGFQDLLRNEIQKTDAIVHAFTIKDHSMGASFKLYDDRQFCNGHRSVTMGMPVGYIVSGDYTCETNLQTVVEGRANVGGNFMCGVATDELDPDNAIRKLATNLKFAVENKYSQPSNFYGVGGSKIFRDLIYQMKGMMKEDHKFFKAHNQYDFPHKKKGTMLLMYLVGAALSNSKIKSKMGNMMNEGMLMPYKKILEEKNDK
ncbi:MAG: NAD(P)H-dependent oxidoreductase [Clostridia bacterium]|nr:NAD(P)H-dependent oxidoreductase [Clostridia bacterium]